MKKGFYFMLVTTIFLMVFLTIFFIMNTFEDTGTQNSENYRVQLMNDFLNDFENDIPRAMYVASFRSFIALEEEVFITGDYYDNLEDSFSEVFFYGTVNGSNVLIMNDSSLNDYLNKVNIIANKLGLNIDYVLKQINLTQNSPWEVKVRMIGEINFTDDQGIASWLYNVTVESILPIFDLRDPLYTIGANGKLPSPIKQWNDSIELVDGTNNDTYQLQKFLNGTYYLASDKAPSFLMRFKGNNSFSPNGIVSLVNLRILGDQGINIEEGKSVVDYIYFAGNFTSNYCNITNMLFVPDWFIIDQNDANTFEINKLGKQTC